MRRGAAFRRALAIVAALAAFCLPHGGAGEGGLPAAEAAGFPLDEAEVRDIVARCLHFAGRVRPRPDLTIAVSDTEGNALAVFHTPGVPAAGALGLLDPDSRERRTARALAKAGTAAYFSSDQESFTTRTAAFIIADHFPPGVNHTQGGPLYGVEFSSFAGSDVNPITFPAPAAGFESRVRGDLGGIALFRGRRRVGGLGLDDGDAQKQVSIPEGVLFGGRCEGAYRITLTNLERGRNLERIAMAAARPYLPPHAIRAGRITVNGLRLPFSRAPGLAERPVPDFTTPADGDFDAAYPLRSAVPIASRFAGATLDPPAGEPPGQPRLRGQVPLAFPVRAGTDGLLSEDDVRRILWQGARRASITRGAIRRPVGVQMQCWISVVDTLGEVLGVFRFQDDATLFSYDVSVQKARTAMFFSDTEVAWSSRGLGLFAQGFYPSGQQDQFTGPLFQLQDGITVGLLTGGVPSSGFPLRNGITIFPGGVPLYRNGQLIGGVGVSGDGVDQDDIVATFAAEGFGAPRGIRCDAVPAGALRASLGRSLDKLEGLIGANPGTCDPLADLSGVDELGLTFLHSRIARCRNRLRSVPFVAAPSYVKFPRHPGPVTR